MARALPAPRLQGIGGGKDQEEISAGTLTAAAGAAATLPCQPRFRYWVDELLWSQGRVATIQIEEVLDAMGGQRSGGPHKLLAGSSSSSSSKPSPAVLPLPGQGTITAAIQQLQQQQLGSAETCSEVPAASNSQSRQGGRSTGTQDTTPAAAAATAAAAAAATPGSEQQQQQRLVSRNSSSSQLNSAGSSSSSLLELSGLELSGPQPGSSGGDASSPMADASAAAAAAAGSDTESGSGLVTAGQLSAASKRPDDHLLGYHHLRQWDLLWTKSVYAIKAARQLQPGQLVSAIAGLNCLTMKKRMVQTLRMALGAKAFSILPLSFCIPEDLTAWQAWLASPGGVAADTGLWMLKTGQDAGKGLRLLRTSQAVQAAARPPKNPSKPHTHIKVAQLYITFPLLIQRRKFHLRLWLLVTSHSPLRAYLHNQGLVLFSSEAYDRSKPLDGHSVKPAVGHVTNYARNEDTWVWGLERLQQHLGQRKWQALWAAMQQSSALTAAAVLGPMRAAHRWLQPSISNYGFQMLGLDFLVDEALHPWLLEVNSAPSIMAVHSDPGTCSLIKSTKQAMLHDMLAMVQHRLLLLPQDGSSSGGSQQQQGKTVQLSWQQELAAEMANRGGFEPLMGLFPVAQQQQQGGGSSSTSSNSGSTAIPWQEVDIQLQRLLAQQDSQQQQQQ